MRMVCMYNMILKKYFSINNTEYKKKYKDRHMKKTGIKQMNIQPYYVYYWKSIFFIFFRYYYYYMKTENYMKRKKLLGIEIINKV